MSRADSFLRAERVCLAEPVFILAAFVAAAISTFVCAPARGADNDTSSPTKKTTSTAQQPAKIQDLAKADELVKDALFSEISGDLENRSRLLDEARSIAPGYSPAMWHSGQIQYQNRWVSSADLMDLMANDARLTAYISHRERAPDTELGQLRLAQWCESRGLNEQAQAHFNKALEYNPNNLTARAKLGHREIAGQWMTQSEFERRSAEQLEHAKSINTWLPRVGPLVVAMLSNSASERNAASKQFAEISDMSAIPALEYVCSLSNEEIATQLVEKLSQWSGISATKALSRQAIYSPWETARQSAALKLRDRPREEFVPQMLAAMYSPVVKLNWIGTPFNRRDPAAGQLTYRAVSVREGRDSFDVDARTSIYHPMTTPRGNLSDALNQAAWEIRMQKALDESAVALQNLQTSEMNQRVMNCLATATEHTAFVRPDDWWNWWDQENETKYAAEKPNRFQNLQRDVVVAEDQYTPPIVTSSDWYTPPQRHSCFSAGTLVWTLSGPKAIETMSVGDVVLSQNTDSGEVAFKPVLRTTVRQGSEVFDIETSSKTLKATGGHLFWVAGQGWTKTRNLRSGQTLHCASGTVQVSLVTEEPQPEQTYNLVVADFNTYFVGPEKILSHDVTERKPTRSIVPGLARD